MLSRRITENGISRTTRIVTVQTPCNRLGYQERKALILSPLPPRGVYGPER